MNNPFISLCKNSETKNIDNNFVQTLQALIFLNGKNTPELINQSYDVSYKINVEDKTKEEKWFKDKITDGSITSIKSPVYSGRVNDDEYLYEDSESLYNVGNMFNNILAAKACKQQSFFLNTKKHNSYNEEVYTVHEKMHIGEFLIKKLSENLRRLYSANKDGGKVSKEYNASISELTEQQKHIYAALETISSHVNFDKGCKIHNSIFFGKVRHCTHAEAFFYLSLHQHVSPENKDKHLAFFKNKFSAEDVRPSIFKDMANFSYPDSTAKIAKDMIGLLPESFFQESTMFITNKTNINGRFVADLFLHCAKNKIEITPDAKYLILNRMLTQHSYWGKQPASMAESVIKEIGDYVTDIRSKFKDLGEIYPSMFYQNCAANIALHVIDKITDPNPFVSTLASNLENQQKMALYDKYDFSDQKTMLAIARGIINSGDSVKQKKMHEFISMTGEYLENQTISNILALDFSTIEAINPLFMTRKLTQELGESKPVDDNTAVTKRIKI